MSEEIQLEEQSNEAVTEETLVENIVETDEAGVTVEDQARDMGWRPLDEFSGNKDDWKGAGAFVKDAELFSSLKRQGSQIKDLKATLEDMKVYMSKSEQSGYERALKEVQSQQQEAMENFDQDALNVANQEYIKLQAEMNNVQPVQPQAYQKSAAETEFESRNSSWYNQESTENADMVDFAVMISSKIQAQNPNISADDNLKRVEERVRKTFPHRFKNSKRSEPSAVSTGGARTNSKSRSINLGQIDSSLKETAERFVRNGLFSSVEEYIKDAQDKGII